MQLRAPAASILAALHVGCALSGAAPDVSSPADAKSEDNAKAAAPNRVSLTLQQDFGVVHGTDVCTKEAQLTRGFACFRANGTQYHGSPLSEEGGGPSGAFPATTRLLLGFDRVLLDNLTLGVRGGFAFRGGGPKPDGAEAPSFLPFHGEARAAYWFGSMPFAPSRFRIGLFVAGGIAQVDSTFRVRVQEDTNKPPPAAQPTNPAAQTLDAYKKAGTGFIGGGLATACNVTRASALFLEVRFMQLFPSSGSVIAPEIGYEHGF
ncbi:MAG: hypothetical protein QM820_39955 [Minicystis sp.]